MKDSKQIAVIGDIHGCISALKRLYKKLINITEEIYSVGDLIDRGKSSKDVIQFCIDNNIKPVRGNHEDMLLKAIHSYDSQNEIEYRIHLDNCLWNDGKFTYISYIGKTEMDFAGFLRLFKESGHYDFILSLPLKIETSYCIITHAGIVNGTQVENILWNRGVPSKLDKLQIIGHTPNKKVLYIPGHYINIDTGCVYGRVLSASVISKETIEFIKS